MKNICITGFPSVKLAALTDIMVSAGMHIAKPSQNDTNITMSTWHKEVLSSLQQNPESPNSIDHLGKIWEKLACDIFLANYQLPLWGWVESESVWLLKFWQAFEPNTYFLLSCIHPQDVLASYIASSKEPINEYAIGELLDQWLDYHQALLYFYHRNTEYSIIFDISVAVNQAPSLLKACEEQWDINLNHSDNNRQKIENQDQAKQKVDVLAEYLAKKHLSNYPEVNALFDEINATLLQFNDSEKKEENPFTLAKLSSAYRRLSLQKQTKAAKKENELNLKKLKKISEEKQALDKKLTESHSRIKEAEQESELVLLQLHQVQEELEQYFLKNQEKKRKSQEETKKSKEYKKQYDYLNTQKQDLEEKLIESNKHLNKKKQNFDEKLKESEQENELMLLQLHQVQEELEHYFLKYQSQQKVEQTLEKRWQRMLDRNPSYCDYQSIELKKVHYTENNSQLLMWEVTDLNTARREFERLSFTTKISTDGVSLIFSRENTETAKPLQRWPLSSQAQIDCEVDLLPANNILNELATSDLDLVRSILNLLLTILSDESYQLNKNNNKPLNTTALKQVFEQTLQALDNLPTSLRFDTVELKQEQSHPGYDHLWLTLKNLQLGKESWPEFSFRLATTNIPEDQFGTHPRLEFPAETAQVLKSWFAESKDDWGDKMELRFAVPDAMDREVWEKLSDWDRAFLILLMKQIPMIFNNLQMREIDISQNWTNWSEISHIMSKIMQIQLSELY